MNYAVSVTVVKNLQPFYGQGTSSTSSKGRQGDGVGGGGMKGSDLKTNICLSTGGICQ